MTPKLTPSQQRVLAMRAEGLLQKQISDRLGIAEKTVQFHLRQVRNRLGLEDLALLTQWALKHGIAKFVVTAAALAMTCTAQPLPQSQPAKAKVSFAWNPVQNAAGYHLYYGGASRTYTNMLNAGSTNITVSNLFVGSTYYFAATDFNAAGLESVYSAEVAYKVPFPPPITITNGATYYWISTTNLSQPFVSNGALPSFRLTNNTGGPVQLYFRAAVQPW